MKLTSKYIKSKGFEVFSYLSGDGNGQKFKMPQYKNDKITITGGYWTYYIQDLEGVELWRGWWETTLDFDKTMIELKIL